MRRLLIAVLVAAGSLIAQPAHAVTYCGWGVNQAARFVAGHGYVPRQMACAFDSAVGQRALARAYGEYRRGLR